MKLKIILSIFISANLLFAQTSDNYFNESSDNNENAYKLNLIYGMGITAATFFSLLVDKPVRNEVLKSDVNTNSVMMKAGHIYGDFYYNLGIAGLLYASNYITDNKKFGSVGKSLFESLLVGGLASISIKYIFGRSRPYKEEGNTKFNWFETNNILNSLPSGHVITAFTTSTVLSNYIENFYISIALYSLSGLTAYQRLATDNHWFSDVFLGAGIGIIAGSYFSNLNRSKLSKSSSINFIPFVSKGNYSLYVFVDI
jgi:membrane-associated phospholipid phosphatase